MSEQQNFGFGKFVPGFDFLQNLAKGSTQSQAALPQLSSWVAPTLSVEELDKRIGELKAVHFWLDQNSKALGATIQALELQKMTLATLKGMNFNMADIANALKLRPADAGAVSPGALAETPARDPGSLAGAASEAVAKARAGKKNAPDGKGAAAGVVDPLQWWGALTQQFQAIAAEAMKEAGKNPAVDAARDLADGVTRQAVKAATHLAGAAGGPKKSPVASKSGAAKKVAPKSSGRAR